MSAKFKPRAKRTRHPTIKRDLLPRPPDGHLFQRTRADRHGSSNPHYHLYARQRRSPSPPTERRLSEYYREHDSSKDSHK
jgi:hypothetical protein